MTIPTGQGRVRLLLCCTALAVAFGVSGCTVGSDSAKSPSSSITLPAAAATSAAAPASSLTTPPPATSPSPTVAPTTSAACNLPGTTLDCDMQQRISAVNSYIASRPGTVGFVIRDRKTGASYRSDHAGTMVWTASTIKLAMVVDLYTRDHAGTISLTAADRTLIQRMLHSSDDDAADSLWFKYAGDDHMAFNNDFANYGLTDIEPQRGFSKFYPYWGFQKCTPDDLDRLIQYVLTKLPPEDTSYIVNQLQNVDPDQQWGVWGAGAQVQPGNKDGWSEEQGGWVINSVGFTGPDQRYTLAIMNSLNGEGGYDDGVATDSHVAELLLAGRP